jgi:hypothetical protein
MATVFNTVSIFTKSNVPNAILPQFQKAEQDQFVANYWGSFDMILNYFAISENKLEELFSKSPTKEVALKITSIGSKDRVNGTWISFDSNNKLKIANLKNNDVYFVLKYDYFGGEFKFTSVAGEKPKRGMKEPVNFDHIVGLLGKSPDNKYFLYVRAANIVLSETGIGGNSFTAGAKIPAT